MMKWGPGGNLRLGSNVMELLLPQRRPFLMVDFVDAFAAEPKPALEAGRHVSANEAYFEGHFPGLHLWPGTLTLEGLGQAATILIVVLALRQAAQDNGAEPDTVLEELRNLERGFRFHPGFRAQGVEGLLAKLRPLHTGLAIGASLEAKFHRPVFAGQRLDYRVVLTDRFGDKVRFEAEACVEGTLVASGVLTGAHVARPIPPFR